MQPSTTYQLGRKQTTHRTGRGLPFAVEFAAVAVVVAVAIADVAVVVVAIGEHCLFHFQCFFMLSQTCRSLTLQGCSRVRLII